MDRDDGQVVRFNGKYRTVNQIYHDGMIRPAVGVQLYQVFRANRAEPADADGRGCTYNHQPMIAHWRGKFYVQYAASRRDEHEDPMEAYLTESADGRRWSAPRVAFPAIEWSPGRYTLAHQRMGFYAAPNGRLLVLSFYGIWREGDWTKMPNTGYGIGRAVREVQADGGLGPIHFIRYMPHAGYTESNTSHWYPFFQSSSDFGFVKACEALLADKLITQQWWEEDRAEDGFFAIDNKKMNAKAFNFYHRQDGNVVGFWKQGWTALSEDEGRTWSEPVQTDSMPTSTAKQWGQRTSDGRYAVVWNPTTDSEHRYPLCVATGEDGIDFDGMLLVHGEVPVQRHAGWHRELGPQYVRGMEEGNGNPPDGRMWLVYSMNKEDIWVAAVPVPITGESAGDVFDDFEGTEPGGHVEGWNVYSPLWAPVSVEESEGNRYLALRDKDPYDYAKAFRVFPRTARATISFDVRALQAGYGRLEIEAVSPGGSRPFRFAFDGESGSIIANQGAGFASLSAYEPGKWHSLRLDIDLTRRVCTLSIDGNEALKEARWATWADDVERLEFRTGPYRREDARIYEDEPAATEGLPGCDFPVAEAVFHVDNVRIETIRA